MGLGLIAKGSANCTYARTHTCTSAHGNSTVPLKALERALELVNSMLADIATTVTAVTIATTTTTMAAIKLAECGNSLPIRYQNYILFVNNAHF